MKYSFLLPNFLKLTAVIAATVLLLSSCGDSNNAAAAGDSAAAMSTADSAAARSAPMASPGAADVMDTTNMQTDTSGGKDVVGGKDKPPKRGDR